MALPPVPNEKRVGPIGYTPITDKNGKATNFFARQWLNLVGLVQDIIDLKDDSASNAARITALEGTEIGGTAGEIDPVPAPLSDGNITLSLADSGVTPDTYGDATNVPQITVDSKGRVTGVTNVPISGGGGGGGSGAWEIVSDTTIGAPTASIIETGLAYDDLLVLLIGVTQASTGTISLVVSDDNGSTYKTTSGDYISVSGTGTTTNAANLPFHTTASVNARTGNILITAAGLAATQKVARVNGSTYHIAGTENPIDAIRIAGSAGNMTGGRVIILGRSAGGGGGASLTVEEDSVPVETAVDTLNFSTAFNVTNPATGQADIDIGDVFVTYVLKAGFGVLLDTGDGSFLYAGD